MQCLQCGSQEHLIASCPNRPAKGPGKGLGTYVVEKIDSPASEPTKEIDIRFGSVDVEVLNNSRPQLGITIDHGAAGNVMGSEWLLEVMRAQADSDALPTVI